MARGFGARETVAIESKFGFGRKPGALPAGKQLDDAVEFLKKSMGETGFMIRLEDFMKAFNRHTSGKSWSASEAKQSKLNLVKAVLALPKPLRDFLILKPEEVEGLRRGVKDTNIGEDKEMGWVNGNFVFGFTPDEKTAKGFAIEGSDPKVIEQRTLLAFKGGIDLVKFAGLAVAYNLDVARSLIKSDSDRKLFEERIGKVMNRNSFNFPNQEERQADAGDIRSALVNALPPYKPVFAVPNTPEGKALEEQDKARREIADKFTAKAVRLDWLHIPFAEREVLLFGVKVPQEWVRKENQ